MSPFGVTWSPLLFGLALFLSSALLFLVQPMVGRTMQPHLGGSPAAWSICLVFFQTTLLAGYVYADLIHRFRGLRWQPWLHLFLMAIAVILCFVGLFGDHLLGSLGPRLTAFESWPILTTLCLLIVVMSVPFFAIAAVTPLVQRWFAHLDHPKSSDPYFLMVASNLGGLAALVVYPLLIEPFAPLYAQWLSWKLAVTALGVLVFVVALCAWQSPRSPELEPVETPKDPNAPLVPKLIGRGPATWPRRLHWFFASALPVGLLLSVSEYLTAELTPMPLIWALPLALYVLAFSQSYARFSPFGFGGLPVKLLIQAAAGMMLVLAALFLVVVLFSPRRPGGDVDPMILAGCAALVVLMLIPSTWLPIVQPISALAIVAWQTKLSAQPPIEPALILLYLACFYLSARLCLGMLATDRPAAPALTAYYGWIGFGGLCGGLFQLLIAPALFSRGFLEYSFLAALATILRPAWSANGLTDWLLCRLALPTSSPATLRGRIGVCFDILFAVFTACLAAFILALFRAKAWEDTKLDLALAGALVCVLVLYLRPLRFGLALAAVVLLSFIGVETARTEKVIVEQRGTFGSLRVTESTQKVNVKRVNRWDEPIPPRFTERSLLRGTTRQDLCITDPPEMLRFPTGEYHRKSPIGCVMRGMEWFRVPAEELGFARADVWMQRNRDNSRSDARVAASLVGMASLFPLDPIVTAWSEPPYAFVGLGTGTMFTYAHPFQWVDAYELDPALIALSTQTPPMFHYYQSARQRGVQATLIPGDGRRGLAKRERERFYHVIVVDGFSSDAVPIHLFTQEAVETYFRSLAPKGIVCIRVSNRHVDLTGVLEQNANKLGLFRKVLESQPDDLPTAIASQWVVLTRDRDSLERWTPPDNLFGRAPALIPNPALVRVGSKLHWTDEHASVPAAIKRGVAWPSMVYGMLILILFFGIFLGMLEIAYAMTSGLKS